MYIKFGMQNLKLKLTCTIHHVESERNYSTTFSVTYLDTEFFSTTVPELFNCDPKLFGSYLTAVPEPFDVNSRFAGPVIFIALYIVTKSLSTTAGREWDYNKRASACDYQSRVRNDNE